MSKEEEDTQELFRHCSDILNKLTPHTYNSSATEMNSFAIDTLERLQGVLTLIHEKAINEEENLVSLYAVLCRQLSFLHVMDYTETGKYINFQDLLIPICESVLEKSGRRQKIHEIEECTDPENKKILQSILKDEDRRAVGNVRFVGELYKQQLLTIDIIKGCSIHLLKEGSFECLAQLLMTVGKYAEIIEKEHFSHVFRAMKKIVDDKDDNVNERTRSMLQDVIELRDNKWVARRS